MLNCSQIAQVRHSATIALRAIATYTNRPSDRWTTREMIRTVQGIVLYDISHDSETPFLKGDAKEVRTLVRDEFTHWMSAEGLNAEWSLAEVSVNGINEDEYPVLT